VGKGATRRAHHVVGTAEFIIGRAFARPGGLAYPTHQLQPSRV